MADDPTLPRPTKRPLLPRWLKFLLILVGTFFFLAAGAWVLLDIVTRQDLRAALAEIRAQGWATEQEELYPDPIPDSENAALVYQQAFGQRVVPLTYEERCLADELDGLEAWSAMSDEERSALRAIIADKVQYIELLHQASQLDQCQFGLEYSNGLQMLGPHLYELLPAARILGAASVLALAEGRVDEALERWLDLTAMVRHQERQGILYAEIIRLGCLHSALHTLEALVESGQLSQTQLTQALDSLEGIEARTSFVDGLRREVLFVGLNFAPSPEIRADLGVPSSIWDVVKIRLGWASVTRLPGRSEPLRYWLYFGSLLGRPWRQHDHATYLARHVAIVGLADRPYYEVRGVLGRPEFAEPVIGSPLYFTATPLATVFVPELGYDQARFARLEAQAAAARTGLALELYRLAHGDYPEALTNLTPDLLPDVPVDPFDGEPLRYINAQGRVAVYSVGPDFQDDGGSEEEGLSYRPKDIVFTVRRIGRE